MKNINYHQLEKLLTISNPREETIYGVIGRMEVLLDYFQDVPSYHSFIPFLKTYYYVTKASADKYIQKKHFFWSMQDYETLNTYFASLYFKPMLAYLKYQKILHPWKQYFFYSKQPDGIPVLQMLLGINAHINTDLYLALVDLSYRHQNDFFLVNDILQEVSPSVIDYLAKERDIIGISGLVLKDFMKQEFHWVIERWRSEAWANMLVTTPRTRTQRIEQVMAQTELIGEQLIVDFTSPYKYTKVSEIIKNVNELSVAFI